MVPLVNNQPHMFQHVMNKIGRECTLIPIIVYLIKNQSHVFPKIHWVIKDSLKYLSSTINHIFSCNLMVMYGTINMISYRQSTTNSTVISITEYVISTINNTKDFTPCEPHISSESDFTRIYFARYLSTTNHKTYFS